MSYSPSQLTQIILNDRARRLASMLWPTKTRPENSNETSSYPGNYPPAVGQPEESGDLQESDDR